MKALEDFYNSDFGCDIYGLHSTEDDSLETIKEKCVQLGICDNKLRQIPFSYKYYLTDKGYIIAKKLNFASYLPIKEKCKYNSLLIKRKGFILVKDEISLKAIEDEIENFQARFDTPGFKVLKPQRQYTLCVSSSFKQDITDAGYNITEGYAKNGLFISPAEVQNLSFYEKHTYFAGYFVRISHKDLEKMALTGKVLPREHKDRNSKTFTICDEDGKQYSFNSQKECYETMFNEVCSERTFKRAIKNLDKTGSFMIKKKIFFKKQV